MSLTGCQINQIDVIFHLRKSLEIFDNNSADKIWIRVKSRAIYLEILDLILEIPLCFQIWAGKQ